MLQQSHSLLLHQLADHIAQDGADGVETLICLADVTQTNVVEQDLLDNKDGYCLAELRACLHDAKTEGDNLCCEEKVDDLGRVVFDERTNNAKGGKSEVFKRTGFGSRVKKGIEEKRNVSWIKKISNAIQPQINIGRQDRPCKNNARVSVCEATHCSKANALHTRLEAAAVS